MRLTIKLKYPNCADGYYQVKAKGCIMASLHWANDMGELPDWTPFAYLPISAAGEGSFLFTGGRAIPEEASYVLARAVSADYKEVYECVTELPAQEKAIRELPRIRLAVISDIHIANKPGRLLRTMKVVQAMQPDALLLSGDLVNDGRPEQFALLRQCLSEWEETFPIFCCPGNHDYPYAPASLEPYGYLAFSSWLHTRNLKCGAAVLTHECGAASFFLKTVDIFALNAVAPGRRLSFGDGSQITWLNHHLEESSATWHIILCHAPLLGHNSPKKESQMPYFSKDRQLQEVIGQHKNVIYISGHTHISPNIPWGCAEFFSEQKQLYLNAGSVCPTELKDAEALMPAEWADGNIMELEIGNAQIQITNYGIHHQKKIARGYYVFPLAE